MYYCRKISNCSRGFNQNECWAGGQTTRRLVMLVKTVIRRTPTPFCPKFFKKSPKLTKKVMGASPQSHSAPSFFKSWIPPPPHGHHYVIHSPVSQQAHPSPDFSGSTCLSLVTLLSLTVQTLMQC